MFSTGQIRSFASLKVKHEIELNQILLDLPLIFLVQRSSNFYDFGDGREVILEQSGTILKFTLSRNSISIGSYTSSSLLPKACVPIERCELSFDNPRFKFK